MTSLSAKSAAALLAAAAGAVERRNTIPILANVLIEFDGAALSVTGTDLDVTASRSAAACGGVPWSATAPAEVLRGFIGKLPDKAELSIEPDGDNRLVLISGRARLRVQTLPATDFPQMSGEDADTTFDAPAEALATMLKAAVVAVSAEEARYYLNGVYLHASADRLTAVATDGYRMVTDAIDLPDGAETMPGVIVPTKAVRMIVAMLGRHDAARVTVSQGRIGVVAGDETVVSKLIDGTFPDYQRVIPAGNAIRAQIVAADLLAAVARVVAVSDERGRPVKLSFRDGALDLEARNASGSEAVDEVAAAVEGGAVEIGVNARYLADVVTAIGGETADFRLADAGSPMLLVNGERRGVIMPMRV